MNQERDDLTTTWPHQYPDHAMPSSAGEDDFAAFLDLDTDFPAFQTFDNVGSGLDTPMGHLGFGPPGMPTLDEEAMQLDGIANNEYTNIPDATMQQHYYNNQMARQGMTQNHSYQMPPTPVSAEMYGAKYGVAVDSNGQILYDQNQVCRICELELALLMISGIVPTFGLPCTNTDRCNLPYARVHHRS